MSAATRHFAAGGGSFDRAAPAIEVTALDLARGRNTILKNITFSLGPCEFVGMLGPNGAGKTTLLHALLGLVPPAAGTIRVLGATPRQGNPSIGYMPQQRSATAGLRLRGYDIVAAAVQCHRWGLPRLDRDGRRDVAWALEVTGAAELARAPLAQLSGGQRQRLLLAQALVGRPRLLLLDEPLISLDPRYQRDVIDVIRHVQRDLDITVLLSAHELNPLLGSLDRVLYLGNGQAVLGEVDDVITGPVLSRLYGAQIDVVRLNGRVFVMSGDGEVERDCHGHHGAVHHA
jgi:zinc/manganese transport system ATP-binding protein